MTAPLSVGASAALLRVVGYRDTIEDRTAAYSARADALRALVGLLSNGERRVRVAALVAFLSVAAGASRRDLSTAFDEVKFDVPTTPELTDADIWQAVEQFERGRPRANEGLLIILMRRVREAAFGPSDKSDRATEVAA